MNYFTAVGVWEGTVVKMICCTFVNAKTDSEKATWASYGFKQKRFFFFFTFLLK